MKPTIRLYEPFDEEPVVKLSLRAWEPVFAAVEQLLGSELFSRLRGDWRAGQAKEIRDVLADPAQRVWVAKDKTTSVGFVAARLHADSAIGEIYMIAVDPHAQGQGIGTALAESAADWLRQSGMAVAMIETGARPRTTGLPEGRLHRPARRPVLQGSVADPSGATLRY